MLSICYALSMSSQHADLFRCFTRSVFAAQAALLKYGDVANAPFGQSTARWRVLFTISSGTTTVAAIARSTGYSRQAVQRLADALVSEGSASYRADAADRRTQRIELTTAGQRTLEQMEAHFDVWAGRLLAQIPRSELAAVVDALGHFTAIILADMQDTHDMKERK
jgi:DNA-binding MarR family transcriptional regulator